MGKKGKCYTITITDGYGDGLCCDHGDGYYKGWLDDVEMEDVNGEKVNGGTFNDKETVNFCIGPTKAPTLPPTKAPTSAPTKAPIQASCVDEVITIKGKADGCKKWLGKTKNNNKKKKKCKKKRIDDKNVSKATSNQGTPIYDICRKTCGELGIGVCKNMKTFQTTTQKTTQKKKKKKKRKKKKKQEQRLLLQQDAAHSFHD